MQLPGNLENILIDFAKEVKSNNCQVTNVFSQSLATFGW